ncbi:MAG: aryl-sulfate sulfotransferase [Myxococcales bacterium]|nr:aryl-sulfate sulfotransferase [Myxococcales bacterium]
MWWQLLQACGGPTIADGTPSETVSAETGTPTGTTPGQLSPVVSRASEVEAVLHVTWEAPAGAVSRVEVERADGTVQTTVDVEGTQPDLALIGLPAGEQVWIRAVSDTAEGRLQSARIAAQVAGAPTDLPHLAVDRSEPGAEARAGWLLATVTTDFGARDNRSWIVIWDLESGEPSWWWTLQPGHVSVTPSLGATPGTIVWDDYDLGVPALTATAFRAALDGTRVLTSPLPLGHHAVAEVAPGQLAWCARDTVPGALANTWITADRVYVADADATEAPTELVGLRDAVFGGTYAPACEHPALPLRYDGHFPVFEWSHLNSLVRVGSDWWLFLRWTDTMVRVDGGTGEVVWRMGGPDSDFTAPDGSPLWDGADHSFVSHPHLSDAWESGFVAFDNGDHATPKVSSLVVFEVDQAARTVRQRLRFPDPRGRYVGILGDARRLPGGHVLGSWSVLGELDEVTLDGEELWRAHTVPAKAVGRVIYLPELPGWAP